jgi:hypothetical protein
MKPAEALADRVRNLFDGTAGIREQKMFGAICFMLDGNMLVGAMRGGELLVRVSPAMAAEALSRPGVGMMKMGEREMTGFVAVQPDAIIEDSAIANWIAFAEAHVRSLPPK